MRDATNPRIELAFLEWHKRQIAQVLLRPHINEDRCKPEQRGGQDRHDRKARDQVVRIAQPHTRRAFAPPEDRIQNEEQGDRIDKGPEHGGRCAEVAERFPS